MEFFAFLVLICSFVLYFVIPMRQQLSQCFTIGTLKQTNKHKMRIFSYRFPVMLSVFNVLCDHRVKW